MYGKCNRWRVTEGSGGGFDTVTWGEADAIAKQFKAMGARNVKIEDLHKLPPYRQKEVDQPTLNFFEAKERGSQ